MSEVPDPHRTVPSHGSKGQRTRARILASAEEVFGRRGFHDASISEITRQAGLAQGSFYVYFASKHAIFEELILIRGAEMRGAISSAIQGGGSRASVEVAGLKAFFTWIAEHPWLYRVVRQAEFIDPGLREEWYREFNREYALGLQRAMERGEIAEADPELLAWAIMGAADFVAMRFIVWSGEPMTDERMEEFGVIALRALGAGQRVVAPEA